MIRLRTNACSLVILVKLKKRKCERISVRFIRTGNAWIFAWCKRPITCSTNITYIFRNLVRRFYRKFSRIIIIRVTLLSIRVLQVRDKWSYKLAIDFQKLQDIEQNFKFFIREVWKFFCARNGSARHFFAVAR